MQPIKNPAPILKRARTLAVGETIAVDDLLTLHGTTYRITSMDTRWVGRIIHENSCEVLRPAPPPDPMVVATKRIRARTSVGKLEALLAERAIARRRLTMALNRLDTVEKSIADLARAMAEDRFKADLAALAPLVP